MLFSGINKICSVSFRLALFVMYLYYTSASSSEITRLTILQTSDIHGKISNPNAGILRMSSLVRSQISGAGGHDKALVIDCGDIFAGSPEGLADKGTIFMKYLNYAGYDCFIPGNHEFDEGFANFQRIAGMLHMDMISGNIVSDSWEFCKWKIYNKAGLKVCVIGIAFTGAGFSKLDSHIRIIPVSRALERMMPVIIGAKPDVIILAVHLGIYTKPDKDTPLVKILKKYPQIDVILAGHSHEAHSGSMPDGRIWVVQPGAGGEFISKTIIECEKGSGKKTISSELMPVRDFEEDENLKKLISWDVERACAILSSVIGKNRCQDCSLPEAAARAMAESVNARAGIYGLASISIKNRTEVTWRDFYQMFPYPDEIVKMNIRGGDLKKIIKAGMDCVNESNGRYGAFALWGLRVERDNKKKIKTLFSTVSGKEIGDADVTTVAMTSYYSSGAGRNLPMIRRIAEDKSSQLVHSGLELRKVFMEYIH